MPLLMKQDEAFDPSYVGFFGSPTIMPDANRIPQFIRQHAVRLRPKSGNPHAIPKRVAIQTFRSEHVLKVRISATNPSCFPRLVGVHC